MAEPSEPLVPEIVPTAPVAEELPPFTHRGGDFCLKCNRKTVDHRFKDKRFALYKCRSNKCGYEWKTQPHPRVRQRSPQPVSANGMDLKPVVIKDEWTRLQVERDAGMLKSLPNGVRIWRRDIARKADLDRRTKAGEDPIIAWKAIIESMTLGFHSTRGKNLSTKSVLLSYINFLKRMEGVEAERAIAEAKSKIYGATSRMAQSVLDIADGNFEDTQRASLQLKASLEVLKATGVSGDKKANQTTNNVSMNVAGNILQVLDGST
jgi:hypothetical protein